MIELEHTFQSADDIRIVYREWLPAAGDPLGIVFIAHGLGEHSGRYRHVAAALTAVGFACYGIDFRGHGLSAGLRVYIHDGQLAVDELESLYQIVRAQHPDLPALLFGHSMGSLIGLGFVLRHPDRLRGIALGGVALHGERAKPAWLVSLCLWAAKYIPKLRLSPPGSPTILTGDAAALQAWWADPLIDKGMWRIGTSASLAILARKICERVGNITLPTLALHGGDDHLTPVSGAHFLAQHIGSEDVTVKIYEGLHHELVNEIRRDEVITTLRDWLLAHI